MFSKKSGRFLLLRVQVASVTAVAILFSMPVHADKLGLAQVPLFLTSTAPPNIMLMLDDSGSMANIVPETPYDDSITYTAAPGSNTPTACPANRMLDASTVLSVVISISNGGPVFAVTVSTPTRNNPNATTTTTYSLGTTGGSTACFNPNRNVTYAGVKLNYNYNNTGGYLATSYNGNYLNWYFNPQPISGSYTATWNGGQSQKPLTGTVCPTDGGLPCVSSRIKIARQGAVNLVNSLDTTLRVGFSSYNGSGGGTLRNIVSPLIDTTTTPVTDKRTALNTIINSLQPANPTPLAGTLQDIGRYFANGYSGQLTLHPSSGSSTDSVANVFSHSFATANGVTAAMATTSPITMSCQRNFAVLLTDGRPSADRTISADLRDYKGDCAAGRCDATADNTTLPAGPIGNNFLALNNGVQQGRSYEASGSDYLDDVAQALYDMDLRPDRNETFNGTPFKNNVTTYFVGFADPAVQTDPLLISSAKSGGGTPDSSGNYLRVANNSAALASVFSDIISNINASVGSASSAAASSTQLNTGTQVLQASFNSGGWSGDLKSFLVSNGVSGCSGTTPAAGELCTTPQWSAADKLKLQNWDGGRNILTYDSGTRVGKPFRYANLNTAQIAQLQATVADSTTTVSNRVQFLRGNTAQDGSTDTPRNRNGIALGDIINSAPVFVGPPSANYSDSTYAAFRTSSTNSGRLAMAYVAANDGMVHAFDASTGSGKGSERFAFVPNAAFGPNISQKPLFNLTQTPFSHMPIVDGTLQVTDAKISNNWASVLVGGMGAGGRAIYALDVTNPGAITESTPTKVLWEFSSQDDADLGYTIGTPSIVKMKNGQWAAIFGNGYTTTSTTETFGTGKACLFIAFLEGPTSTGWATSGGGRYQKICTSAGSILTPNGLASPAAVDVDRNADEAVDFIYAGDEMGNMWRFDVNDPSPSNWKVGYGGNPLFTAKDASNNPQPITEQPEVGYNLTASGSTSTTNPKLTIYFGTGRYLGTSSGSSDNTTTGVQTFYGIFDSNLTSTSTAALNTTRSSLLRQDIIQQVAANGSKCAQSAVTASTACFRITSQRALSAANLGWYMDLVNTDGNDAATAGSATTTYGERQVSTPILRNGRIIFTTLIPSTDPCNPGGGGWLMELDAKSGGRTATPSFNTNGDRLVDQGDYITIGGVKVAASGTLSLIGVPSPPAIISLGPNGPEVKQYTGTGRNNATSASLLETQGGRTGRITWREIQQ